MNDQPALRESERVEEDAAALSRHKSMCGTTATGGGRYGLSSSSSSGEGGIAPGSGVRTARAPPGASLPAPPRMRASAARSASLGLGHFVAVSPPAAGVARARVVGAAGVGVASSPLSAENGKGGLKTGETLVES